MFIIKKQSGVGLIEALIAALVFAIGIAALVKLQGISVKNGSAANARSVAMGLAQEKIEEFRGFSSPADFTANIVSSTAPNSQTVGNTAFARSWTVKNYYYDSAGTLTTPVPSGTLPDQKDVTVTVNWTDPDGSSRNLALESLINSKSGTSISSIVNYGHGAGSGTSPVVPYTPSTDVHVVPVGVGTNTKRETLVPASTTVDGYSRTKFIAYTYKSNGGGLVREEEFQNVACNCLFNGTSDDNNPTYAAAHPQWDAAKDTYTDVDGDLVSDKVKGCVQGGGSNCDANPEPFCEICCRDHHDISSETRLFDPYRSSDDFTDAGDHKHYYGTTPVTSGLYLESCRFKRVNGYWRAFQDWEMIAFTVLPLTDLTDTTKKAIYQDYLQSYADEHIDESKVSGETLTSPPSKPSTLDHTLSNNYINMAASATQYLTARGVYLDFIDSDHLTKVQAKKAAGVDYLVDLPYYELEVAPESRWLSNDITTVIVGPTSSPGNQSSLTAGQLSAVQISAKAVPVTGTIKKSNSGIVALNLAIDYNAVTNPDTVTKSDVVDVCVKSSDSNCGGTTCALPWSGTLSSNQSTTAYQSQSVPYGSSCVSETRTCNNGTLSGSYTYSSCSVLAAANCATPWGTSVSKGSSVTAYQASSVISPDTCASETRTCTNGTLSGSYTNQSCTVQSSTCSSTVNGTANTNRTYSLSINSSSAIACTISTSNGSNVYTCPTQTINISDTTLVVTEINADSATNTITIAPNNNCGAPIANFHP